MSIGLFHFAEVGHGYIDGSVSSLYNVIQPRMDNVRKRTPRKSIYIQNWSRSIGSDVMNSLDRDGLCVRTVTKHRTPYSVDFIKLERNVGLLYSVQESARIKYKYTINQFDFYVILFYNPTLTIVMCSSFMRRSIYSLYFQNWVLVSMIFINHYMKFYTILERKKYSEEVTILNLER